MPPIPEHSPIAYPLTQNEEILIEIAVRLACAVKHWERSVKKGKDDQLGQRMKNGIDGELVRMLYLF